MPKQVDTSHHRSSRAARPPIPPSRFPERLAQLGYQASVVDGIEAILPPLCAVPAGQFLMGSDPAHDKQALKAEQPQHPVMLPAYRIARHPVTVAEYACFVRTGHAEPRGTYILHILLTWQQQCAQPDHPVVGVSWHDAAAYAAWLATLTGQPWRLPSEAEWEKAARWDPQTATARLYPWGDGFDKSRTNTRAALRATSTPTTPIGSYPGGASPCGAQDMAGNVWEWTSSLFQRYPYHPGDGRERPDSAEPRVQRGGAYYSRAREARAAYRNWFLPHRAHDSGGFRLARAPRSRQAVQAG